MEAPLDHGDQLIYDEEDDFPVERKVRESVDISAKNRDDEEMEEGEISGPEETNFRPPLFSKSARSGLQITIGNRRDGSIDSRQLPVSVAKPIFSYIQLQLLFMTNLFKIYFNLA